MSSCHHVTVNAVFNKVNYFLRNFLKHLFQLQLNLTKVDEKQTMYAVQAQKMRTLKKFNFNLISVLFTANGLKRGKGNCETV
jgi:hypothetical protein